ncbi:MAG: ClbS/DfsB family four-helix bundle protein [Anaerolineales bacterium]|nr:ClbS/DfsB family four-helix bundle protein [Anaerolineales bacterium]
MSSSARFYKRLQSTRSTTEFKMDMLKRIEKSYLEIMNYVSALNEDTILERAGSDQWSIKDILAHLAAWEEILLRFHIAGESFEDVVGNPEIRYQVTPFDKVNQHLYEVYKEWTLEEVKEFSEGIHNKLIVRLAQLTIDELRAPPTSLKSMDSDPGELNNYIAGNTYKHYLEHLETIRSISSQAG